MRLRRLSAVPAALAALLLGAAHADAATLTSGALHACAITSAGTASCWGDNTEEQSTVDTALGRLRSVSNGAFHSCAVKAGGAVACWGYNASLQTDVPAGLGTARDVAAGYGYSCALLTSGLVSCWGDTSLVSTLPSGLGTVRQIDGGIDHACAVTTSGSVTCWGADTDGKATPPGGIGSVLSVVAGSANSCAVKADRTVACWGNNDFGQNTVPGGLGPVLAVDLSFSLSCAIKIDHTVSCWGDDLAGAFAPPSDLGKVIDLTAGEQNFCARKVNGVIRCWGDTRVSGSSTPAALSPSRLPSLSTGVDFDCAVTPAGDGGCWGRNSSGQATLPSGIDHPIEIAAGGEHTCAQKNDGTLSCWGLNGDNQTDVTGQAVFDVDTGEGNTCAVASTGEAACWGSDGFGQLSPPSQPVIDVSVGGGHSCAVRIDGPVACWGWDGVGQVTPPGGLGNLQHVSAGSRHSCAVKADGTAACWGDNFYNQRTIPSGLGEIVQITAGTDHTCAIKANGTAVCWGRNDNGEATVPSDLGTVIAIDAQTSHTCAVTTARQVRCWGVFDGVTYDDLLNVSPSAPLTLERGTPYSISYHPARAPMLTAKAQLTTGAVPAGLTLDPASGVLTGTPSDLGGGSFSLRAVSAIFGDGPTQSIAFQIVDTTAPQAPTITSLTPQSPSDSTTVGLIGSAETGSTVRVYASAGCTGEPLASAPAAQFVGPGITVTVPADAITYLRATATDESGNVSACGAPMAYTHATAPTTPQPTAEAKPPVSTPLNARPTVDAPCAGFAFQLLDVRSAQRTIVITGVAPVAVAGQTVVVQAGRTSASTKVGADGRFTVAVTKTAATRRATYRATIGTQTTSGRQLSRFVTVAGESGRLRMAARAGVTLTVQSTRACGSAQTVAVRGRAATIAPSPATLYTATAKRGGRVVERVGWYSREVRSATRAH